MDLNKILTELRAEHDQLTEAIASIERLALGGAKRRGRPPAWMSKIKEERRVHRTARGKNKNPDNNTKS
jgi:hypothetical protein